MAWFIRQGVGIHYHTGSQQAAQTDVLPATARSDILGVLWDQRDAQKQPISTLCQNELRCGRVVQISPYHLPLGEA